MTPDEMRDRILRWEDPRADVKEAVDSNSELAKDLVCFANSDGGQPRRSGWVPASPLPLRVGVLRNTVQGMQEFSGQNQSSSSGRRALLSCCGASRSESPLPWPGVR